MDAVSIFSLAAMVTGIQVCVYMCMCVYETSKAQQGANGLHMYIHIYLYAVAIDGLPGSEIVRMLPNIRRLTQQKQKKQQQQHNTKH